MSFLLDFQALKDEEQDGARTITSSVSLALCGSSISLFWC